MTLDQTAAPTRDDGHDSFAWNPVAVPSAEGFDGLGDVFGEDLTDAQRDLRSRARAFADAELAPWAAKWDEDEVFPARSYEQLRKAGLLGLTVPTEYGGGGLGVLEGCLVVEQLATACVASAMVAQSFLNGPWRVIRVLGTDEQRERLLPGVAAGTRHFAIAMSEPGAGSAGTDLTATLTPDGDEFVLTGDKCWITGGREADTIIVFCRAPGSSGPYGIGAVVVDTHEAGFPTAEVDPKMGFRGVAEAAIRFDGWHVRREDVVIEPVAESKRGATLLVDQFNPERCGNCAMSLGIAQSALDHSVTHLRRREQFGRPLDDFQGLRWKIADMALDVHIARTLTYRAAATDEGGFPEQRSTVLAKLHTADMVQRVTNNAIQIHGARGYSRRWPIERMFRDGRGLSLAGGTSEVMRNLLASHVIGRRVSQRGSSTSTEST